MHSQEMDGEKKWGRGDSQPLRLNYDKMPNATHVSISQTGLGCVGS